MRILALGDIVGRPGRRAVAELLPGVIRDEKIDFVIANGENAAAGSGITPKIFQSLREAGVGCVTLGDHFHKRAEILKTLDDSSRILRPANLSARGHGRPFVVIPTSVAGREIKIGVFAVSGRLFMSSLPGGDPFESADRVIAAMPNDVKVIVCDVHAEATSEKQAMGWHLAGRTSLVFGTHTHIPTADATILNKHTAYITDVGMTGPYDSVLGRKKEAVLSWMTRQIPQHFEVATGDVRLSGVLADIDESTGRSTHVERFERRLPGTQQAYDADDRRE
ncbi:MAG: TIGR00282 family metallophosphoesterase [Planctomycetota bacterium]